MVDSLYPFFFIQNACSAILVFASKDMAAYGGGVCWCGGGDSNP